jgi:hypothetical protein
LEPFELLEYLPPCGLHAGTAFQEGKPLFHISEEGEGSTELVEYSHTVESLPDHQVYIASLCNADDDESGPEYEAELLADVSADEHMTDAP